MALENKYFVYAEQAGKAAASGIITSYDASDAWRKALNEFTKAFGSSDFHIKDFRKIE